MSSKLNLEEVQAKLAQMKKARHLAESNDYRDLPKNQDLENDVFDSNNIFDSDN